MCGNSFSRCRTRISGVLPIRCRIDWSGRFSTSESARWGTLKFYRWVFGRPDFELQVFQQKDRMILGIWHGGELLRQEAAIPRPVLLDVGVDQRLALRRRNLRCLHPSPASTGFELGLAAGPKVARPLRVAARGDQVPPPLKVQRQDGHREL